MIWWIELIIWIGLLVLTLYRRHIGKLTVSQKVEKLLPRAADVALVIVIAGLVWWQYGEKAGLVAIRYMMIGHLLLGHETYEGQSWKMLWYKITSFFK